mmetsp:Transcript_65701/g.207574  ORF Transcript_65701/g.207574 Transcript_65701/m.207574 type:complete len:381 (-) Transcript_65701:321-1463(-)
MLHKVLHVSQTIPQDGNHAAHVLLQGPVPVEASVGEPDDKPIRRSRLLPVSVEISGLLRREHAINLPGKEKKQHVQVNLLDKREDLRHKFRTKGFGRVAARHAQEEHVPDLEGVLRHCLVRCRPDRGHRSGQALNLRGPLLAGGVGEEERAPRGGRPGLRRARERATRAAAQELDLAVQQAGDAALNGHARGDGADRALDEQQDDGAAQGLQDEVRHRHPELAAGQELLGSDERHHEPDVAKVPVLRRDHAVELVQVYAKDYPQEAAQAVGDVPRNSAVVLRATGRDEEVVDLCRQNAADHDADDTTKGLPDRAPQATSILLLGAQDVGSRRHRHGVKVEAEGAHDKRGGERAGSLEGIDPWLAARVAKAQDPPRRGHCA